MGIFCKNVHADFILQVTMNHLSTASEFLQNCEEMFLQYYLNSDVFRRLNYLTTQLCIFRYFGKMTLHYRNVRLFNYRLFLYWFTYKCYVPIIYNKLKRKLYNISLKFVLILLYRNEHTS